MKKDFGPTTIASIILLGFLLTIAFKKADDFFLSKASQANLTEIETGKLAASKGNSAQVKRYGQQMVDDHSIAQKELVILAKKESLSIPKEPDENHKALKEQLMGLSGNAFDSAYLKSQLLDHQAMVLFFQEETTGGTDPDAIAYAKKYLQKLKMHLNMFQSAFDQSMNMASDSAK
jgi:putative membrane protein